MASDILLIRQSQKTQLHRAYEQLRDEAIPNSIQNRNSKLISKNNIPNLSITLTALTCSSIHRENLPEQDLPKPFARHSP